MIYVQVSKKTVKPIYKFWI